MQFDTSSALAPISNAISSLVSDVISLVTTNTPVIMGAVVAVAAMGIGFKLAKKFIGKVG